MYKHIQQYFFCCFTLKKLIDKKNDMNISNRCVRLKLKLYKIHFMLLNELFRCVNKKHYAKHFYCNYFQQETKWIFKVPHRQY